MFMARKINNKLFELREFTKVFGINKSAVDKIGKELLKEKALKEKVQKDLIENLTQENSKYSCLVADLETVIKSNKKIFTKLK
jgi:hypothetical protein